MPKPAMEKKLVALSACLSLTILSAGCPRKPEAQNPPAEIIQPVANSANAVSKHSAELTANEILQKLLATYRQAKFYEDNAVVRLAFRQNGQPMADEQPAAIAFERPNKLSVAAYQSIVKCDGKELKARIDDPPTNHVDNQIVIRPAPKAIKLTDLATDELLYDTLSSRLRRQPIQLELLLESGGLVAAFGSDIACRRLNDAQHDGKTCFRIEVPSPGGPFIFWVDRHNSLLRRLDYPAAALIPDLANDPSVTDLALFADLRGAQIGQPIPPGRFILDVPPNAKQMKRFARPPLPLPSDLFGQQPQPYFFTRLDGSRVADKDFMGKIVILVWYHDNAACEATLQQVASARERLTRDESVAFYAVATDPTTITADALNRRLENWKVDLPIIRDLEAFGDKSFHIENHPTIVVLDKRGCVQIFQVGGNPQLADSLVTIVERLERGNDLAAEIVAQNVRDRREYEQLLARGGPEPGEILELPEAVIRRRSEPKKLQLTSLWSVRDFKFAGNIVLAEHNDRPTQIFVLTGGREVIEVGADGKIIRRHTLELPLPAVVTFARTAIDKNGKRYYIASAPLAPQVFIFDSDWKLQLAYPPAEQAPLHVVDLAMCDLDGKDGLPEILVASAGDVGLVALSLTGDVRWRNRTFANALSVAVTSPDEFGSMNLLVAGESGSLLPINRFGNDDPPVQIAKWPIGRIFSGPIGGDKQAGLLALSVNAKGEPFAIGLNDKHAELWNYPLPPGVHQRPIEPITGTQVFPGHGGQWWLAGPDGSVHIIAADGQFFDSFHYGAALSGLAACKLNDRPTLLMTTDDGLAAFEVALPIATKKAREY